MAFTAWVHLTFTARGTGDRTGVGTWVLRDRKNEVAHRSARKTQRRPTDTSWTILRELRSALLDR